MEPGRIAKDIGSQDHWNTDSIGATMEKLKKILKKLLFPHIAMVILLVPIATVLLIYALALGNTDNAIAYLAYFLSAYALTILCARSPYLFKKAKAIKQENKYITQY